jgi:hypothetical protein
MHFTPNRRPEQTLSPQHQFDAVKYQSQSDNYVYTYVPCTPIIVKRRKCSSLARGFIVVDMHGKLFAVICGNPRENHGVRDESGDGRSFKDD